MNIARVLVAIGFLLTGLMHLALALTYFNSSFSFTLLSLLRMLAIWGVPVTLLATSVAMFRRSSWTVALTLLSAAMNLFAGYSLIPMGFLVELLLHPIPFASFLFLYLGNAGMILLAIMLNRECLQQTPCTSISESTYALAIACQRKISLEGVAILAAIAIVALMAISCFTPLYFSSVVANRFSLTNRIDSIALHRGSIVSRTYLSLYFHPEPFYGETYAGWMPSADVNPNDYGKLKYDFRFLGFGMGSESQRLGYRFDVVNDWAIPLWPKLLLAIALFVYSVSRRESKITEIPGLTIPEKTSQ